jgi:hypothetical protein
MTCSQAGCSGERSDVTSRLLHNTALRAIHLFQFSTAINNNVLKMFLYSVFSIKQGRNNAGI